MGSDVGFGVYSTTSKVCILSPPKLAGDKMQTFDVVLYFGVGFGLGSNVGFHGLGDGGERRASRREE